jgi:prephenate dehydrogenase
MHTIAIVGVGLMGGSIGLALRKRKIAKRIIGIGRRPAMLRKALALGAVTETTTDLARGVAEAEWIILGTPVETLGEFVGQCAAHCPAGAIITDVGSTKESVVQQAEAALAQALAQRPPLRRPPRFVGSHPMAGSEKAGVQHARADLLSGRTVVVTPSATSDSDAVKAVQRFWKQLGAKVVQLSPAAHDQAVADISHLPHVVASALAAATAEGSLPLAASGWGDTTRIAAGSPELWRQILLDNRLHTLRALAGFEKVLTAFRQALEQQDAAAVQELLEAGKRRRDSVAS